MSKDNKPQEKTPDNGKTQEIPTKKFPDPNKNVPHDK